MEKFLNLSSHHVVKIYSGLHHVKFPKKILVLTLEANKMKTKAALFSEVSMKLKFPSYFSENFDSMDECINDLEWLPSDGGYLLIIKNAENLLINESNKESLVSFISLLENTGQEWAEPVELGEPWDRPGKPFYTILESTQNKKAFFEDRLNSNNVNIPDITLNV